jgi:hypothetical protein
LGGTGIAVDLVLSFHRRALPQFAWKYVTPLLWILLQEANVTLRPTLDILIGRIAGWPSVVVVLWNPADTGVLPRLHFKVAVPIDPPGNPDFLVPAVQHRPRGDAGRDCYRSDQEAGAEQRPTG